MTTLITGAHGQTGSYLVEELLNQGEAVIAIARNPANYEFRNHPNYRYLRFDVLDDNFTDVIKSFEINRIVNLASASSVAYCEENPSVSKKINFEFVERLVEFLDRDNLFKENIELIQASSSEMYAGISGAITIDKTTKLTPQSIYGIHKALAHEVSTSYRLNGGRSRNLVLFNHESERRTENFVSKKISKGLVSIIQQKQERLVLGNIEAHRDWGYAKEFAQGIAHIIMNKSKDDDLFLATGETHSVFEFFSLMAEKLGLKNSSDFLQIDNSFLRKYENSGLTANPNHLLVATGWHPKVKFSELVSILSKKLADTE